MDIVLRFFRLQGSEQANKFMGTFAGPGGPPSEWVLLQRDIKLLQAGVRFLVIAYSSANPLPLAYISKVAWSPYFEVTCTSGNQVSTVTYPQDQPLTAASISLWALTSINAIGSNTASALIGPPDVVTIPTSTEIAMAEGASAVVVAGTETPTTTIATQSEVKKMS
ncbi:MAG: hypothetical protein ACMG6E_01920, partial [Candidatus Roizmanbacteria bacterium]